MEQEQRADRLAEAAVDLERAGQVAVELAGAGVDDVRKQIRAVLEGASPGVERDVAAVTNVRHAALLERAHHSMTQAWDGMEMTGGPDGDELE